MCSINVGSVITYYTIKHVLASVTSLQPAFGSVLPAIPKQVQNKCKATNKHLPRLPEVLEMLSLCVHVWPKACMHACMHKCRNICTQISLKETEVEVRKPWTGVSRILSLLPSVLCAGCRTVLYTFSSVCTWHSLLVSCPKVNQYTDFI